MLLAATGGWAQLGGGISHLFWNGTARDLALGGASLDGCLAEGVEGGRPAALADKGARSYALLAGLERVREGELWRATVSREGTRESWDATAYVGLPVPSLTRLDMQLGFQADWWALRGGWERTLRAKGGDRQVRSGLSTISCEVSTKALALADEMFGGTSVLLDRRLEEGRLTLIGLSLGVGYQRGRSRLELAGLYGIGWASRGFGELLSVGEGRRRRQDLRGIALAGVIWEAMVKRIDAGDV